MNDSTIMCDEVIEEIVPTNLNKKKQPVKRILKRILLVFLLITIALLIAVIIYCYLIKY